MEKNILLSICIPTFNRSAILKQNLQNLLSSSEFDDEVELVISDNCSTDNTDKVVADIIRHFPEKRIVYNRNETNIKDKNFLKVMSLGSGFYLKLYNDYTLVSNDDLKIIKNNINRNLESKTQLFFYNDIRKSGINLYDIIKVNCTDEYVKLLNNKITWISNFGCWKEQLKYFYQYDTKSSLQLLQMMWTLFLVSNSNNIEIVNMNYKLLINHDNSRFSYNFFEVHVNNYYSILDVYNKKGLIDKDTIYYDKKRVLADFIGGSILKYLLFRRKHFKNENSWRIILSHFGKMPYFYIFPLDKIRLIIWKRLKNFF